MSDSWLADQWDKVAAVGASIGGAMWWTARRAIGVEARIVKLEGEHVQHAAVLEKHSTKHEEHDERLRVVDAHEARIDALEQMREDVRSIRDFLMGAPDREPTNPGFRRKKD